LGPVKYVVSGSPHRRCTSSAPGARASSSTRASVRVSCQTIAGATGIPVRRSHTTVVSRWLAMPIAAIWLASIPPRERARGTTFSTFRQISMASCSTQPGRGKCWACSRWSTETSCPRWSKTMHRVDVVPWSMEMT
jgi:hypothetical protein